MRLVAKHFNLPHANPSKNPNFPKGCHYIKDNDKTFLNSPETGRGNAKSEEICIVTGINYFPALISIFTLILCV